LRKNRSPDKSKDKQLNDWSLNISNLGNINQKVINQEMIFNLSKSKEDNIK